MQHVSHERGAEAASAVENQLARLVRHRRLDVTLDNTLSQMFGSFNPRFLPLVILAHVDHSRISAFHSCSCLVDADFLNSRFCIVDYRQEPGRMVLMWRYLDHSLSRG